MAGWLVGCWLTVIEWWGVKPPNCSVAAAPCSLAAMRIKLQPMTCPPNVLPGASLSGQPLVLSTDVPCFQHWNAMTSSTFILPVYYVPLAQQSEAINIIEPTVSSVDEEKQTQVFPMSHIGGLYCPLLGAWSVVRLGMACDTWPLGSTRVTCRQLAILADKVCVTT